MTFAVKFKNELPGVAANLLVAFILFAASLMFKPIRAWLFPPESRDYPIICSAEPVVEDQKLTIDFFVINRTGREYTGEELSRLLRAGAADPGSTSSPEIVLRYNRSIGKVASAHEDTDFNRDKGLMNVSTKDNDVWISVQQIKPRAIMRIAIEIADLPDLRATSRMATGAVPFKTDYQDACYRR